MIVLAGLLSIVVQVVLLRELSAAFYGADLIYLLALGAWLLWTAAGALLGRASLHPSATRLAVLLAGIGVVVPLDVVLIRRLRLMLGGIPGAFLPLPTQIAASALCLLPSSLLLGLLFQWAAKRYLSVGGRRSLARAYAIESLGGVIGGLATTITLHWGVQNFTLGLATAAVAFAAAIVRRAELEPRRARDDAITGVAVAGLIASLGAITDTQRLDLATISWTHPDVVENVDSPYGRVTIAERDGQVSVYDNDSLVLESQGTAPEEFVHLSLLQHERPRRVFAVGGAVAGLVGEVCRHGVDRLDTVEMHASVIDALARRLPALDLVRPGASAAERSAASLADRRAVRVVFGDPRRILSGSVDSYDVILVAANEPSSAQANRLFTREFFQACAGHLRPGGLLALRLASIENFWTPVLIARTGSIYAALRQVFPDVVVLPGNTNVVLASASPLTRDPQVLADRLAARNIRARLVTPRYLRYVYSNDRYAEIQSLLAQHRASPNSDANAASYQATSLLWLSKFVPSLGRVDLAWVPHGWGWSRARSWLLLVFAATGAALLRRGRPRPMLLVAATAAGGMALETLLLLHYQLKHGVVFQDLGVLLMSVMAGLAAGAWFFARLKARPTDRRPGDGVRLLLFVPVALALLTSASIRTGYGTGLGPVGLTLFATGVVVAAVFAWAANQREPADQRRLVSPLYAADVVGGCLGSVAASLVMIPLLGLPLTAEWLGGLAAALVLLV